jgi:hypothetical protein
MRIPICKSVCEKCQHYNSQLKREFGTNDEWGCTFYCESNDPAEDDWYAQGVIKAPEDRVPPWCIYRLEHLMEQQCKS